MKAQSILFFFSFLCFTTLFSQNRQYTEEEYRESPHWRTMMGNPEYNFFETQKAFRLYWEGREVTKGSGFKPFKRWEYRMSENVDMHGNYGDNTALLSTISEYLAEDPQADVSSSQSPGVLDSEGWEEVGPFEKPTLGFFNPSNGLGRLNTVAFHPTQDSTWLVGSPAGGIWRTEDAGASWEPLFDDLGTMGVSEIVINPSNPDHIVFGSGDRDGFDADALGIFQSTDGGITWSNTSAGLPAGFTISALLMLHTDTLVCTLRNGGIYRTTNGGATWQQTLNANDVRDMVIHPTDSNILYAVNDGNLYRSSDKGSTWIVSSTFSGHSRLVLGVSPDEPEWVYVFAATGSGFGGMYLSTNGGTSFTLQADIPNIMDWSTNGSSEGGQAWYDMCMAVSPTNASEIYTGGVNTWKSTDAGETWTIETHWNGNGGNTPVHADHHSFRFHPNGDLFDCNDGGLYIKQSTTGNWIDRSSGLRIGQLYKLGQSAQSADITIAGYQDNGSSIQRNGEWYYAQGGDGMECIVHPEDSNLIFAALYYGLIGRGFNGVQAGNYINNGIDEEGQWISPYDLAKGNSDVMFLGMDNIWRTMDCTAFGVTWENIGGAESGKADVVEPSPHSDNVLYIAIDGVVKRTDNALDPAQDVEWTTLNTVSLTVRDIEVHTDIASTVYLAAGSTIFRSDDSGVTWVDISGDLPTNATYTSLLHFSHPNISGLYATSKFGVYFLKEGSSEWMPYSTNLPFFSNVREIEAYIDTDFESSELRIATYGRGMWKARPYSGFFRIVEAGYNDCNGEELQLRAVNGSSYRWKDDQGNIIATSDTLVYLHQGSQYYIAEDTVNALADTVYAMSPQFEASLQVVSCDSATFSLEASILLTNQDMVSAMDLYHAVANDTFYGTNPTMEIPLGDTVVSWIQWGECRYDIQYNTGEQGVEVAMNSTNIQLCSGEEFQLQNSVVTSSGVYADTLWSAEGLCYSLEEYIVVVDTVNMAIEQLSNYLQAVSDPSYSFRWFKCVDGVAEVIPNAIYSTFLFPESGFYELEITTDEGCVERSGCLPFARVDLNEEILAELNIFPNPFHQSLTLNNPTKEAIVCEIYDFSGRKYASITLPAEDETQWDLHELNSGIYTIQMRIGDHQFSQSVLKQ